MESRIEHSLEQAAPPDSDQIPPLSPSPDLVLEALRGDYNGNHSIRINTQWRIIFRWQDSGAYKVSRHSAFGIVFYGSPNQPFDCSP